METGLFEAGFFLKKLMPPKPLIDNSLSLRIFFSDIPPSARIFVLFRFDKLLNLYKFK